MKRFLTIAAATLGLLALSGSLSAHDPRLHGANALTGEIAGVSGEGLSLKTKTGTVKVKYSSQTKFEHDEKDVDKSHVHEGDRAGVVGSKLPSGEWMANQVILGLEAPKPAAAPKGEAKKDDGHKH